MRTTAALFIAAAVFGWALTMLARVLTAPPGRAEQAVHALSVIAYTLLMVLAAMVLAHFGVPR